jgi:uncharacterized protein (TIGR00251 family)
VSGPAAWMRAVPAGVTLAVRAQPGAKKTAIVGVYGEGDSAQLKIQVHAPPIEGRANAALIEFLAQIFDLPRKSVELVSGESSRSKVFLLRGASVADVKARIDTQIAG